jgi:quercetin dioxygenase-like cupin family protein
LPKQRESWKQIVLDDESMWPKSGVVELPPPHVDQRGAIQPLVDFPMKNVSLISSKKGTVRSNHYHVSDWHYMYVLSGSFEYHFRRAGSLDRPVQIKLRVGEMVFTPPMEEHATVFLEDTEILVASRNVRDQDVYEADVKRVKLVDPGTKP